MKSEAKRKTEELLKTLNLTEKKNCMANALSGGMLRKLCIGNALVGDHKVLSCSCYCSSLISDFVVDFSIRRAIIRLGRGSA